MSCRRHHIFACGLGLALLTASAAPVCSAAWQPRKPIEFVVPTGPGGSLDTAVREVQKIWVNTGLLKVPVSAINKSGGGQSVGAVYVHLAQGDPHRIMIVSSTLLSNNITGRSKLKYSDFTILGQLYTEYMVVSVNTASPIKTGADLISRLKAAPDALSVAVGSALGNTSHLGIAIPMKLAGVDIRRMRTVVFSSGPESITSLLGGHVDIVAGALSSVASHWRSGKVRILGITAPQRLEGEYATIPTWREQGINATVSNWRFIIAPPGLTKEQIAFWDDVFRRTVASPEWKILIDKYEWVNDYVPNRIALKYLEKEDKQEREILTDLGLAK